jgi:hypothetical protein
VELIQQLINYWDWELVLRCLVVQSSVVDAEAPGAIRQQDRSQKWGRARPDDALGQHGSTLLLKFVLLKLRVPVREDGHRYCARQQVDLVVIGTRRWQPARLIEDRVVMLEEVFQQQ